MSDPPAPPPAGPPAERAGEAAAERSAGGGLPRRLRRAVLRLARDLAVALVVVGLVGTYLVQPFRVEGASMQPELWEHDRILVDKLSYRVGEIARHDVVVVESPEGRVLVKRVVGMPGDTLELRGGWLFVDGHPIADPYVGLGSRSGETMAAVVLGRDEYFVLGDNRAVSFDSRSFGPVSREAIHGRAVMRYWPPGGLGPLP